MRMRISQGLYEAGVLLLLGTFISGCTSPQPPYECAAQNNDLYQVRYYRQSSTCEPNAGFLTAALVGDTAGMQTYMLISPNGTGGPSVIFRDEPGNLDRSATKLGLRLRALLEANLSPSCDDASRTSSETHDPNLFLMLPRYGEKGVCRAQDAGIATSTTVFPKYSCKDGTSVESATIKTELSDFAIIASSTIPGNIATGTLAFEESNSAGEKCTSVYRLVQMNPIVQCATDVDCSPVPVSDASRCSTDSPATNDYCFTGSLETTGRGASNQFGSGLNPFLFRKYPDGGFDLRNTCDPVLKRCIWDSDAGN